MYIFLILLANPPSEHISVNTNTKTVDVSYGSLGKRPLSTSDLCSEIVSDCRQNDLVVHNIFKGLLQVYSHFYSSLLSEHESSIVRCTLRMEEEEDGFSNELQFIGFSVLS